MGQLRRFIKRRKLAKAGAKKKPGKRSEVPPAAAAVAPAATPAEQAPAAPTKQIQVLRQLAPLAMHAGAVHSLQLAHFMLLSPSSLCRALRGPSQGRHGSLLRLTERLFCGFLTASVAAMEQGLPFLSAHPILSRRCRPLQGYLEWPSLRNILSAKVYEYPRHMSVAVHMEARCQYHSLHQCMGGHTGLCCSSRGCQQLCTTQLTPTAEDARQQLLLRHGAGAG